MGEGGGEKAEEAVEAEGRTEADLLAVVDCTLTSWRAIRGRIERSIVKVGRKRRDLEREANLSVSLSHSYPDSFRI